MRAFAAALAACAPVDAGRLGGARPTARAELSRLDRRRGRRPARCRLGEIIAWLRERLPDDAIVTNGAGNYASWLHRFYQLSRLQDAARADLRLDGLRRARGGRGQARCIPSAWSVAFAGDGCFLMTGQEFATAVQYGAPIIVIVVNNGMYGTIRMHQERDYPGARHRHRARRTRISPRWPAPMARSGRGGTHRRFRSA